MPINTTKSTYDTTDPNLPAQGLSASQFTGDVNWYQVKEVGISFGLARATQGDEYVDSKFYFHWSGMKAAGIVRGAYHVFEPYVDVERQVEHFLKTVQMLEPGDLPPVLDIEIQPEKKGNSQETLTNIHQCLTSLEIRLGRRPVIYTRPSFWNNNILQGLKRLPDWLSSYDLWLALFTDKSEPTNLPLGWKQWVFWHFSDRNNIDGVNGPIDLHRFDGSIDQLTAYAARISLLDPNLYIKDGREQLERLVGLFKLSPNDIGLAREKILSDSINIMEPFRAEISQSLEHAEESALSGDWRESAGWLAPAAVKWMRWLQDEPAWREVLTRVGENPLTKDLLDEIDGEMTPLMLRQRLDQLAASSPEVTSNAYTSDINQEIGKKSVNLESNPPSKTPTKIPTLRKPSVKNKQEKPREVEPEIPTTVLKETVELPTKPQRDRSADSVVIFQTPAPPPDENRISIDIQRGKVVLVIGNRNDRRFESRNLLSDLKNLKQLELASSAEEFGEYLFRSVINDTETNIAYRSRTTQDGYNQALNDFGHFSIELRIDENLAGYQWELLKRPGELPLAIIENNPLYRVYGSARAADKNLPPVNPLKILIAICNPISLRRDYLPAGRTARNKNLIGLDVIDVIGHRNAIENSLQPLQLKKMLEYEIMTGSAASPVTIDAVKEKLQEGKFHVLHLVAHGITQKGSNEYCVVMEDEQLEHSFVFAEQFNEYLGGRKLRLVVFANCHSGNLNLKNPLALSLVENVAPAVISMQRDVPLQTVQLFAQRFYGDLASSGQIDMAMSATRQDLYSATRQYGDWAIPALLIRPGCAKLFHINSERTSKIDRPNFDDLKQNIKTNDQLGGLGDPTRRRIENMIESQAEQFGLPIDSQIINAMRGVLSSGNEFRPPTEPSVSRQDRRLLSALSRNATINWTKLSDFIKKDAGGRLELPDSTIGQLATALNSGKHVILNGPPGTGKTSLAEAICRFAAGKEMRFCNGHVLTTASADWTTFDTVGGYMPDRSGILQFRSGVFLDAINAGKWLIIDEINRADIDKSFGELFTVLSGQAVTLPYEVDEQNVRIIPSSWKQGKPISNSLDWIPSDAEQPYDFVIHPNWRIIGTMNNYDKSALFQLSFAFMRRFAFIDVELPSFSQTASLIDRWLGEGDSIGFILTGKESLVNLLLKLLSQDESNPLMKYRAIGPAILKDLIYYMNNRDPMRSDPVSTFTEAFLLYVAPQLDGLDSDAIMEISSYLRNEVFASSDSKLIKAVINRIRMLYPHIPANKW